MSRYCGTKSSNGGRLRKEQRLIPKECKRLAEVDFPTAVVSAHAAREKSTRHGHPSTLHLWWARRTNALCALLKVEQERSPDFLRLANALSALYPKGSEEKRLLDAMLLAAPR